MSTRIRSSGSGVNLSGTGLFHWKRTSTGPHLETPIEYNDSTLRSTTITSNPSLPYGSLYRYMEDLVTPGFANAKKKGRLLPVNPCKSTKISTTAEPTDFTGKSRKASTSDPWIENFYSGDSLAISSDLWFDTRLSNVPSLNSGALLQASLAKIKTRGWDVGTSASEFHKTIMLFVGLKRKFIKLVEQLVKKTLRNRRISPIEVMNELSSAYLEARYGWRILFYEIEDFVNHVNAIQDGKSGLVRYTSYDSATYETSYQKLISNITGSTDPLNNLVIGSQGAAFRIRCHRSIVIHREMRAMVGALAQLQQTAFASPAVTAWELVPFSFVLDWFINIDEIIKAWSSQTDLRVVCNSLTDRISYLVKDSYVPEKGGPTYIYESKDLSVNSNGSATFSQMSFERSSPGVSYNLSLKFNMDAFKFGDLLALFWQVVLKSRL